MATRPSKYPTWASSGIRTEPVDAKKALGWTTGEKPAAQYANWVSGVSGDWIEYLDSIIAAGSCGDGSDGNITLDGSVAAPSGMSKSGSVYTLTRPFFAKNLTVTGAGVQLFLANLPLFVDGICTTDHVDAIHNNAAPTTGQNSPAVQSPAVLGSGARGGNGGNVSSSGATGGDTVDSIGGNGGRDGSSHTAGSATAPDPAKFPTSPRAFSASSIGFIIEVISGTPTLVQLFGGAGGCGGNGTSGGAGGGGGNGAGVAAVVARSLDLSSPTDIRCKGGDGGPGAGTGSSSGYGGGGGGGGGLILAYAYCNQTLSSATNCPGGVGGTTPDNVLSPGENGVAGTCIQLIFGEASIPNALPTYHEESGVIALTGVETTATATFNTPFANVPTAGGYEYSYSWARTDGTLAVPAFFLSATMTTNLVFTLVDQFAGSISWQCRKR